MSDWWVRAHWGRAFEILHIEPQIHNMSWAVMRKRDVELTTDDIERPDDDPRELEAVRHNVRQLQREAMHLESELAQERASRERERALHERELDEMRRGYERSLSWRITGPLRAGARRARRRRDPSN
jgi:hypothetical protein